MEEKLNQVTSVSYHQERETRFDYDRVGNRLRVTDDGRPTDYLSNKLNEYTSVGGRLVLHDGNGNLAPRLMRVSR